MTTKSLLHKIKLSDKDFEEIASQVKKAETGTSGEIALALTAESSSYAIWELLAALLTSFLVLVSLYPLSPQIYSALQGMFWSIEPWHLTLFYTFVFLIMTITAYFLYNIPAIDSVVIPSEAKNQAVKNRAMLHFAKSGVYATENHSGILIYVSYFEKQVQIVADCGISQKVSQDMWNIIADHLADNIRLNNVKQGFITAVQECGELLQTHFPSSQEKNELSDSLVILEAEKWA